MQKRYLIGVDLGTSATKAALYQIDGKLISDASVEVPLFYPKHGVVEQENEDFYASAAQTVKKCIGSSGVEPREIHEAHDPGAEPHHHVEADDVAAGIYPSPPRSLEVRADRVGPKAVSRLRQYRPQDPDDDR